MNTLFALIIYNSVMHSAGWQVTAPLTQAQCEHLKKVILARQQSSDWSVSATYSPKIIDCVPLPQEEAKP